MPADTPVDRTYKALLREGKDKGTAARIAQAATGLSLATGRKPKGKKKPRLKIKRSTSSGDSYDSSISDGTSNSGAM